MAPRRRSKAASSSASAAGSAAAATTVAPSGSSATAPPAAAAAAATASTAAAHHSSGATTTTSTAAAASSKEGDTAGSADACLHCHTASPAAGSAVGNSNSHVQVRCDECGGYICNDCHWCHEFQANHEIRVCDRCDAFYCKSCDEMDQCDDCGEVVCGGCSTLLSCKFCGGGLCEDCATACGRCGIVLCSRDAKFAVDCDTCRLSYCLVCLASGSKDPCVRCGHRPSKRMEQLVHLRLKSIYKAFKQSSSGGRSSSGHHSHHSASASLHHLPHSNRGPASAPRASSSTSAPSRDRLGAATHDGGDDPGGGGGGGDWRGGGSLDHDPEALLRAAASASGAPAVGSSTGPWRAGQSSSSVTAAPVHMPATASERLELYLAEKERADKAAADLLAELDEEEEHKKTKKSKKQRKKERQQQLAKKEGDDDDEGADDVAPGGPPNGTCEDIEHESKSLPDPPSATAGSSNGDPATSPTSSPHRPPPAPPDLHRRESSDALLEASVETDPLEEELERLIDNGDAEGIDSLLSSIKGVPGRATLRKNAKKALKRLRLEEHGGDVAADGGTLPTAPTALPGVRESEIERPPSPTDEGKAASTTGATMTKLRSKVTSGGPAGSSRTESSMPIDPAMVGWIIGKGGQRIRDLMEESGARIWIDQDSMGPHDPRTVFFSGTKRNVEAAMALIADLVDKSQTKQSTPVAESGGANKARHSFDASRTPPSLPDPFDLSKPTPSTCGLKPRRRDTAEVAANAASSPPLTSDPAKAEHVITCDPRFVPLLIGRRGWTIKNIQDSSGARVDIDQSVTPRRITISGTDRNVKVAIRMVRDVLSYPHAQLQGVLEKEHDAMEAAPDDPPKKPEANASVMACPLEPEDVGDAPSPPNDSPLAEPTSRGANSPPSSLIMTGDAKSTISASSSLSSTPEPSMASSIPKGGYPSVPSGPMLPPAFGFSSFDATSSGTAAPQSAPISGSSYLFPQETLYGMSTAPAPPMQDPLRSSGVVQSSPVLHPQDLAAMPSTQGYPMGPPAAPFPRSPGGALGPLTGSHGVPLIPQSGSYQPPHTGFTVPVSHASMLHANTKGTALPMANRSEGLWNGINVQPAAVPLPSMRPDVPGTVDGFRLDAAVDFLQSRSLGGIGPPSQPRSGIGSDSIGLPVLNANEMHGLAQGPAVSGGLFLPTPDESQIVDSLFGPPSGSSTSDGALLMTGMQGLSLSKDTVGASLWESAALGGDTLQGLSGFGTDERNHSHQSHLFASQPIDDHHPSQSRFAWGGFADRQQS